MSASRLKMVAVVGVLVAGGHVADHAQTARADEEFVVPASSGGSGGSSENGSPASGEPGDQPSRTCPTPRSTGSENSNGETLFAAGACSDANCPPGLSAVPSVQAMPDAACMGWLSPGEATQPVVTVDDLVPGAYNEAVGLIPDPTLDISPPVEAGGIVNFGLWLAVEPVAPITARAEVPGVWAQVTASQVGVIWDMGNGDIVDCDGYGDPIVDLDTDEQSPLCGYTYEWPSAPQFTGTDDLSYHATVTTEWSLHLTGSDGRDVMLEPVVIPFEYSYQVREIQTVGSGS